MFIKSWTIIFFSCSVKTVSENLRFYLKGFTYSCPCVVKNLFAEPLSRCSVLMAIPETASVDLELQIILFV